jgi:hypothetical protein
MKILSKNSKNSNSCFQVKINGSNEEMLRAAAEQFGDKTVDEVMFSEYIAIS